MRAFLVLGLALTLGGCVAMTPSCGTNVSSYTDTNTFKWADPLGSIDVAIAVTLTCY